MRRDGSRPGVFLSKVAREVVRGEERRDDFVESSSQSIRCRVTGRRAWRCRESFWLTEMESKQRIPPAEETIHGKIFSLPTLVIVKSLESLRALWNSWLSPDLEAGELVPSSSNDTDDT
eukprot:TRINITY_DN22488_c0_g1_i1.p2 TRINITY_DN22488_c0_g1~~TRINITY_DN22488_c0_g1_i1.p2  ORF type:complete len:119 (+),score=9.41 TRINITY_DN22488_c0_g1_i1:118-474(+)